ncbi:hypothetical protein [Cutibacterium avidum]|jgi:hypothetical protein|uniref:Uncharacterized protein n=1 Tax=Cutibacterium avidum ATCC 25577 TaxID=997355 RepID=G4CW95_9ACTN|nr:hypothetical protein [Cutibacterium avidum]EGY78219.1 hypothetical protein HMPREF9153_0802 [Cutibacterium avidum ATCC 25577]QQY13356.1 hypothetical protein JMX17_03995 [Cutibacterium avidum]QRH09909.1 hypothetical protein JMX58_10425 [Cutibacterium avidum]BCQ03697.1 hypothetical protein TPCV4_21410 [Cutibacterium avidum]
MTVLTGAAGHTTLTAASWDQVRRDPELEAVDLTLHILGGRIPQHVVRAELSPTVWLAVLAQTDAGIATIERAVIGGRSVPVAR